MPGRIIPYEKIGDELERQLEQLLRVTVLETDKKLKKASPVDTGRFRWSWQIGQDVANGEPASEGEYDDFPTEMVGTNYQAGRETLRHVYHVHNNILYAEALARGHSPQAPDGWIELVAKRMQSFVDRNWEIIKRRA